MNVSRNQLFEKHGGCVNQVLRNLQGSSLYNNEPCIGHDGSSPLPERKHLMDVLEPSVNLPDFMTRASLELMFS